MIKVYALSTCPWCKKVKKLLKDNNIEFDFIDVDLAQGEEQQKALAEIEELTGRRSFPVTVINDQVIQGFKKEELEEALKNEK
ncbi:MAG: NrdH-redoxin [Firmicutes bacterium ML8_F2]|nr:MAG: NrdH-redoxin [Firmicutes bacterium ML8_F2]